MMSLGQREDTTTISTLTDNVLVDIFDLCRKRDEQSPYLVWPWKLLVHVCRRWRQVIFTYPRRLDLRLLCTYRTPVRKHLGIWPAIPIVIQYGNGIGSASEDNVVAALEQAGRVCRIRLAIPKSLLGKIFALMQQPFPMLTHLSITSEFGNVSPLPDGFLGGSAPSLQEFHLFGFPFPALPTLLLSAGNLVNLSLRKIPLTGFISPEAMVSHLAASPKLKILYIEFDVVTSLPDRTLSPPISRIVLPALRNFTFIGACNYLEDFISRVDTPQLKSIVICYSWSWDSNFDVPQLSNFINRSEGLRRSLSRHCKIKVDEDRDIINFCVGRATSERWDPKAGISVYLGEGIDGQIPHLTTIVSYIFPILSDVVHCTIDSVLLMSDFASSSDQEEEDQAERDDLDWLQLLRQLPTLQSLFVSDNIAGVISRALERTDREKVTEMLPALKLLCLEGLIESLEGPFMSSIEKFIALRRRSGYPVTYVETREEFEERLTS